AADFQMIGTGQVCVLLDVPFSLAADTILIPNDWPSRNPVKGWTTCQKPAVIAEDYQAFIDERLRNHSMWWVKETYFYEDGTGRHAAKIVAETGSRKYTEYFLIYDKSNVRMKVIK